MRHVLSAVVENKPGVLSRVAGLFSRRGFNIESLNVAPTENKDYSRITVVLDADDMAIEQITKQLFKLINVTKISDVGENEGIQRELMFVKVHAAPEKRTEITQTAELLSAKVVDVGADLLTIECSGIPNKLDDLIQLMEPYGVEEIIRTGAVAFNRSSK